jgi:hypothetical protein
MGVFFKRQSTDEKGFDSPPVQDAAAPGYAIEEGIVDEAQDDLHREMRPRQLSAYSLMLPVSIGANANRL